MIHNFNYTKIQIIVQEFDKIAITRTAECI